MRSGSQSYDSRCVAEFSVWYFCAHSEFDTIEMAMLSFSSKLVKILSLLGVLLKRRIIR